MKPTYERDGFEVIGGLFTAAEVAVWQAEVRRLFADPELMTLDNDRTISRRTTGGGNRIDRFDPVTDVSPVFAELASDPRMIALATRLIGGPVLAFKDKLIFKSPGVHGYEVHQDFTAWQELEVPPHEIVSIMVAVDAANATNGAISFFPGLHDRHLVDRPLDADVFSATGCVIDPDLLAGVTPVLAEAAAGSVVAIHTLAPHSSAPNNSSAPRAALFLTYSHARHGDLYAGYYERFRDYRRRSESISVN